MLTRGCARISRASKCVEGRVAADFVAAAHLSVIDYFGDVPWKDFQTAKTWYMKLKSRLAFRPILADRWPGLAPAAHYDDLDF